MTHFLKKEANYGHLILHFVLNFEDGESEEKYKMQNGAEMDQIEVGSIELDLLSKEPRRHLAHADEQHVRVFARQHCLSQLTYDSITCKNTIFKVGLPK